MTKDEKKVKLGKIFLWSALLLSPAAYGKEESLAKKDGEKYFESGVSLFMEKKYLEALTEFEKAHKILKHWAIRFNIASCLIKLGKYADAIEQLWMFLEEGGYEIEEKRREEAFSLLEFSMKNAGKVIVSTKVVETTLVIDGKKMNFYENAGLVYVNPGIHNIELIYNGETIWKGKIEFKAGQTHNIEANIKGSGGSATSQIVEIDKVKQDGTKKIFINRGIYIGELRGSRKGQKEESLKLLIKERKISRGWLWFPLGGTLVSLTGAISMTVAAAIVKNKLENLESEYNARLTAGNIDLEYYNWAEKRRNDLLDKGILFTNIHLGLWIVTAFFAATTCATTIFVKNWGTKSAEKSGLISFKVGNNFILKGTLYLFID